MQNKPIGFILHNRVNSRWYKLAINTFEPYTTGELLNYPEYWMPVYLKPQTQTDRPIGFLRSIKKTCILDSYNLTDSARNLMNDDIDAPTWTPVYKHQQKNFRYALMVEGRSAPTKLHDNLEDAEKEAIRLTEKEKCKVYVLKAISEFCITQSIKKIDLL